VAPLDDASFPLPTHHQSILVSHRTAIASAIVDYDALWTGYLGLSAKFGALAPGLYNDTYWSHPNTGVPGMRQSVDRYRGLVHPSYT
jgi:hypothetical protein